jgi:hypothetical protein
MQENSEIKIPCPNCRNPIDGMVFYCPICGKKIKEPPVGTGFWSLLGLFAISILLPPLNIPLSFKYIRAVDPKAKMSGWVSIGLMVVSLIIVTILTINTINEVNRQVEVEMAKYLGF